jgi:hypothetical protein
MYEFVNDYTNSLNMYEFVIDYTNSLKMYGDGMLIVV